jgi:hypothetical protein
MQIEGAHALWELAVEPGHHACFTPVILKALLTGLKPGVAQLNHIVSASVWYVLRLLCNRAEICR